MLLHAMVSFFRHCILINVLADLKNNEKYLDLRKNEKCNHYVRICKNLTGFEKSCSIFCPEKQLLPPLLYKFDLLASGNIQSQSQRRHWLRNHKFDYRTEEYQ